MNKFEKWPKLMERHPKAKPRNILRLIEMLRAAPTYHEVVHDVELSRNRKVAEQPVDDRVLAFYMPRYHIHAWIKGPRIRGRKGDGMDAFHPPHRCGTAACIAGFAQVAMLGAEKSVEQEAVDYTATESMERYIGCSLETVMSMASANVRGDSNANVRPRHAIAMLEWFLKTGVVSWNRAMGRDRSGSMTRQERDLRIAENEADAEREVAFHEWRKSGRSKEVRAD